MVIYGRTELGALAPRHVAAHTLGLVVEAQRQLQALQLLALGDGCQLDERSRTQGSQVRACAI